MTKHSRNMDYHRAYMRSYQTDSLSEKDIKYKDHYETLGIDRHATHAQVKKSYRLLALKYHPDRNPSLAAMERWDGVPYAYSVLSDPNSRLEYDESLGLRDALYLFYMTHNPVKLDNATIQTIVDSWKGREIELFGMLKEKYEIAAFKPEESPLETDGISLSDEVARSIRNDAIICPQQDTTDQHKWSKLHAAFKMLEYTFCCLSLPSKSVFSKYYAVSSQTPVHSEIVSHTPGGVTPGSSTPGGNRECHSPLPSLVIIEDNQREKDEEMDEGTVTDDSSCTSDSEVEINIESGSTNFALKMKCACKEDESPEHCP